MDIQASRIILKRLRAASDQDPAIKMAVRWVQANLATEYDKLLRVQMLEGVAGVPVDTWWKHGQRGMEQAQNFFEDLGINLNPKWFAKYSGIFSLVDAALSSAIAQTGIPADPNDIIHNALMGLNFNATKTGLKRPAYEAGRTLSSKIKDGNGTPKTVGGVLKRYLENKVMTEARTFKNYFEPMPEEGLPDIADTPSEEHDAGEFLLTILFWEIRDPLGKKIRNFMRQVWAGTGQERSMNIWLDFIEIKGRIPTKKEVAEATGITSQSFIKHWRKAWFMFLSELWKSPRLLLELQKRYEAEHLPWFQSRPDPDSLFNIVRRKMARKARWDMNIRTAHTVLKMLKQAQSKDPRVRIAMRWIQATMEFEYDKMLRAQVLEGAAGVRKDTWWKQGQRGLDKALAFFSDQGDPVKPEWFDKGYSGMYGILEKALWKIIESTGIPFEPYDVLNNALVGLSFDGSKAGMKSPPYEAGKKLADKIKLGKESPRSIAGGKLGNWLSKRVWSEANTYQRNVPLQDDADGGDGQINIADTSAERREAGDYLLNLILWENNDPLGKKLRNFLRKSWAGTGRAEEVMNYWLDTVEKEMRIPAKKEVAEVVGVTPQDLSQKYWPKSWKRVFDALWSNHSLLDQLQQRYESEQLPWFQEKPDPAEVFQKQKSRKASERVALRWITNRRTP